jgi:heptosyltransferase-2/glycosyl transferase protein BlmE
MDLLVGNDSSPAHIAAALRTPTVVVYGPTGTEFLWARIYPAHRGVNKRYPCQHRRLDPVDEAVPCAYACPCAFVSSDGPYPRCLIDISVDEVYEKVHAQLGLEPRAELDPTPSSID